MHSLWLQLALLGIFCQFMLAEPEIEYDPENDPELTPGFFEGDIRLRWRNGLPERSRHWPDGVVYYKYSTHLEEEHVSQILLAMRQIEEVSCIKFKHATEFDANYIHITGNTPGCNSAIGYMGGMQSINLEKSPPGKGCFIVGKIMHELLHSLGFYHQQSAAERDDYVRILNDNIKPGLDLNFKKYETSLDFGVPYDYGSVMHYSPFAFAKVKGLKTIEAINPEGDLQMGQRRNMSNADIARLNKMYECYQIIDTENVIAVSP